MLEVHLILPLPKYVADTFGMEHNYLEALFVFPHQYFFFFYLSAWSVLKLHARNLNYWTIVTTFSSLLPNSSIENCLWTFFSHLCILDNKSHNLRKQFLIPFADWCMHLGEMTLPSLKLEGGWRVRQSCLIVSIHTFSLKMSWYSWNAFRLWLITPIWQNTPPHLARLLSQEFWKFK